MPPHHAATRSVSGVALPQLVSQVHQPRSPPPRKNRANASMWSKPMPRSAQDCRTVDVRRVLTPFEAPTRRKRQPSWRSLSTRASDPASPTAKSTASASGSEGGEGGVGDNGRSEGDDDRSCWKCSLTVTAQDFFCECGAVQPLDGRLDYFEMLGSPPSVFLDLKAVERQFKNMQRAFHPVSSVLPVYVIPDILLYRARPVLRNLNLVSMLSVFFFRP